MKRLLRGTSTHLFQRERAADRDRTDYLRSTNAAHYLQCFYGKFAKADMLTGINPRSV